MPRTRTSWACAWLPFLGTAWQTWQCWCSDRKHIVLQDIDMNGVSIDDILGRKWRYERTYTQLPSAVKSYQVPCSYTYSESDFHALVCTYVVGTSWIFNFLYVNKAQSTIATHQSQLELNHKHQFRKGWKVEVKECKYCHSTYCFHLSLALLIKLVYASS